MLERLKQWWHDLLVRLELKPLPPIEEEDIPDALKPEVFRLMTNETEE